MKVLPLSLHQPVAQFLAALVLLLVAMHSVRTHAAQTGAVSDERWFVYTTLLSTTDSDLLKLAARSIAADPVSDPRLTDTVAKVLTEYLDGTRLINGDTVAWLARSLGPSRSQRYQPVLERLAATKPGNIAQHATSTLSMLSVAAEEFKPRDVDWIGIEAQLKRIAMSSPQPVSVFNARSGMRIEDVVRELGYPNSIGFSLRARRASYANFSVNNLSFAYDDNGEVEFVHHLGDWRTSLITPEPLAQHTEHVDPALADIRRGLLSADLVAFRRSAALSLRQKAFDLDTLDLAAWRLGSHVHANEPFLVDGLAYLCVTLEKAGNPRYRQVLRTVSNDALSAKLKRHAASALANIPSAEVEQFDGRIRQRR